MAFIFKHPRCFGAQPLCPRQKKLNLLGLFKILVTACRQAGSRKILQYFFPEYYREVTRKSLKFLFASRIISQILKINSLD